MPYAVVLYREHREPAVFGIYLRHSKADTFIEEHPHPSAFGEGGVLEPCRWEAVKVKWHQVWGASFAG